MRLIPVIGCRSSLEMLAPSPKCLPSQLADGSGDRKGRDSDEWPALERVAPVGKHARTGGARVVNRSEVLDKLCLILTVPPLRHET